MCFGGGDDICRSSPHTGGWGAEQDGFSGVHPVFQLVICTCRLSSTFVVLIVNKDLYLWGCCLYLVETQENTVSWKFTNKCVFDAFEYRDSMQSCEETLRRHANGLFLPPVLSRDGTNGGTWWSESRRAVNTTGLNQVKLHPKLSGHVKSLTEGLGFNIFWWSCVDLLHVHADSVSICWCRVFALMSADFPGKRKTNNNSHQSVIQRVAVCRWAVRIQWNTHESTSSSCLKDVCTQYQSMGTGPRHFYLPCSSHLLPKRET